VSYFGNVPDDTVMVLELTEEIKKEDIVTSFLCSFNSKSVIVQLNHKYVNKIIELQVIQEDWKLTNERFDNILKNKGVVDEDRIKLRRLLNHNANRITDHFSEQTLAHMHAGRRAKIERKENAKNTPPVEASISEVLRMHEGNVRVKGMISGGSDKIEKMITHIWYSCGECDTSNELADYRETRPRFAYEVPSFDLKEKKCRMKCESFRHELHEEPINAFRIELQDTDTFNDLERLPVVLFDECTKKVAIGEQVTVTGSIQKIKVKGRLLTYVFVGLDPKSTVEYENRKESDELTDADIREFQEFAKSTKVKDVRTEKEVEVSVLNRLISKVAPSVIGLEHVKKGLLFSAVNSGKDDYERKLRINALLIGETGLDKSALLRASVKLVYNSRFISSLNSSIRSQVGIVDKENDNYILRLGPIPRATGAICAIDEIGRMRPEDQEQLLHALQEGKMPFVKHGFDLSLDGRATFIMSSNPKNPSGDWNDKDKVDINEIPLLGPLRDRVGLIFVFRTNRNVGYVIDYAFKKAKIINNNEAVIKEEEENYRSLRKYIIYCKRFDPILSKEAEVMIVQYYANIATKPGSRESPRLFDTLTSLCYAVARIKQKNTIDVDDVEDVIEFYNVQLLHLSQLVAVPIDPRDLAFEEIINTIKGSSSFRHEFIELVKTVRKKNVFIREYIGDDLHVKTNRKLREIRNRFVKLGDNRILILSISPLILVWKDSFRGSDMDIPNKRRDDNATSQEESREEFESDTGDMSDRDKKGNNEENESDKVIHTIPLATTHKDITSHVTPVTPVTSTETGTTTDTSHTSNTEKRVDRDRGGEDIDMDIADLCSAKERDRCKLIPLTDEQVNNFYRVLIKLETESNLQPGSYSSDDKGTIGGKELRNRLVLSGQFAADDANRIVKEIQRIGNIKKVAFDTFRRAS
jgi:DNA replicative helicase MCM subunit Mcm2 (Cdc46/Mcm family)